MGQLEQNLVFLGLAGMMDPPREAAAGAVEAFRRASVRTVMITGDHADTALAIARQLGIAKRREECMTGAQLETLDEGALEERIGSVSVFARVSPEHKVRIVRALKRAGCVTAMTGDGVNDAPALKSADIGIAMGKGGTDVARQAADMILTDDNFATIERAIEEGRGIYENIRKSILFLLSSNLGEILTMLAFAAVAIGIPAPLEAGHILWINLITDSLPGAGTRHGWKRPGELDASAAAPDGRVAVCRRRVVLHGFYGSLIAAVTLGAVFQQTGAFAGTDVCIYCSGAVGALSCGRHALAYGLGIFTQSWEKSADACGSPCGDSDAGCSDGDSFFDETPSHGAAAPGRVAGASPVIRHAAVSA